MCCLYSIGMGVRRLLPLAVTAALVLPAADYASASGRGSTDARPVAPAEPYAVGHRTMAMARGSDRPLPTDVWYPADRHADGERVAAGRFPVVLFSHGLHGLPEHFSGLASAWAAAGLVVVAPAYPHTNARTRSFDRSDMRHQPADAAYVLRRLRRLPVADPLAGHLATDDVAAVGFSAGGFTTTGLLTRGHDPGLRAAVVIAGWAAPGAFEGTPVPLLFVHGDADPIVRYESGRAAYARAGGQKEFVSVPGGRHGEFLLPGAKRYPEVRDRITEFLHHSLYNHSV